MERKMADVLKEQAGDTYSEQLYRVQYHARLLQNTCHQRSVAAGWWNCPITGEPSTPEYIQQTMVPQKLLLIHSEISEACEAHRKNAMDSHLPHRSGVEVELADAMIRILDLAGGLGLDIGAAMAEKMAYNAQRADHKLEARMADGGKRY
jgi:NTP pyrophosphatase (non-canonical NTP hydrolase)